MNFIQIDANIVNSFSCFQIKQCLSQFLWQLFIIKCTSKSRLLHNLLSINENSICTLHLIYVETLPIQQHSMPPGIIRRNTYVYGEKRAEDRNSSQTPSSQTNGKGERYVKTSFRNTASCKNLLC